MEGRLLHPVVKNGVHFFAPAAVHALAHEFAEWSPKRGSRTPGEEAATVFALLDQNKDLRQIVIEARVPPARVRVLYHEWTLSLEAGERLMQWKHPPAADPSAAPSRPPSRRKTPSAARQPPQATAGHDDKLGSLVLEAAQRLLHQKT
jgi:hypothetical protein